MQESPGQWSALGQCPQCGAEVETVVGDPLIDCSFCRTAILAIPKGQLGYLMPCAPEHEDTPRFHLPFWRLRGLRYRMLDAGNDAVDGTLVDRTAPATTLLPPDANLGVRPQAVKLRLTTWPEDSPEIDHTPEGIVDEGALDQELEEDAEFLLSRLIGEQRVIIHVPIALVDVDGARVLRELIPGGVDHPLAPELEGKLLEAVANAPYAKPMEFLPLACPNCGHPFTPVHGAQAILCGHCATAWWPHGKRFRKMPFAVLNIPKENDTLIPFWQIDFRVEELGLVSRADLNRLTIPYRVVKDEWEFENATMLVPGVKLPPRTFIRLGKTATLFFTGNHEEPTPGHAPIIAEPVTMPLSEAVESIALVLAQMITDKPKRVPIIASSKVEVKRARLLFIPFTRTSRELVHTESGQALSPRALELGANL